MFSLNSVLIFSYRIARCSALLRFPSYLFGSFCAKYSRNSSAVVIVDGSRYRCSTRRFLISAIRCFGRSMDSLAHAILSGWRQRKSLWNLRKIDRLRRINKYASEIGRLLVRKRKDDKRDCCRVSVGRVCTTTRVVYRIRNVKYLSERGIA